MNWIEKIVGDKEFTPVSHFVNDVESCKRYMVECYRRSNTDNLFRASYFNLWGTPWLETRETGDTSPIAGVPFGKYINDHHVPELEIGFRVDGSPGYVFFDNTETLPRQILFIHSFMEWMREKDSPIAIQSQVLDLFHSRVEDFISPHLAVQRKVAEMKSRLQEK